MFVQEPLFVSHYLTVQSLAELYKYYPTLSKSLMRFVCPIIGYIKDFVNRSQQVIRPSS
jgi:hypothetical protein